MLACWKNSISCIFTKNKLCGIIDLVQISYRFIIYIDIYKTPGTPTHKIWFQTTEVMFVTLFELIDQMYIEDNKTISKKVKSGNNGKENKIEVPYKDIPEEERASPRYEKIKQINERLDLLFDLPGFVPGIIPDVLEDFQLKSVDPLREAKTSLEIVFDIISYEYYQTYNNIPFVKFMKNKYYDYILNDILAFRDSFQYRYSYNLAEKGDITVKYDNDFLNNVSKWLETTSDFVIGQQANTLITKYTYNEEYTPSLTPRQCNALRKNNKKFKEWHNIIRSILHMYIERIKEVQYIKYDHSLTLAKRFESMSDADEKFIRCLLKYIPHYVEYEGKAIHIIPKLKEGFWEYLPSVNRMEIRNCLEGVLKFGNINKYLLIDSDKAATNHILRISRKLIFPQYYRVCLKLEDMVSCIDGYQCRNGELDIDIIRSFEDKVNQLYDYFNTSVILSTQQVEEAYIQQIDTAVFPSENK